MKKPKRSRIADIMYRLTYKTKTKSRMFEEDTDTYSLQVAGGAKNPDVLARKEVKRFIAMMNRINAPKRFCYPLQLVRIIVPETVERVALVPLKKAKSRRRA